MSKAIGPGGDQGSKGAVGAGGRCVHRGHGTGRLIACQRGKYGTARSQICHSRRMDFGASRQDHLAGQDDIAVVQAYGELDISTVPQLAALLIPAVAAGGRVILEGEGLSFVDSTGASLLLKAHRDAIDAAGRLDLVLMAEAVIRVLNLAGLIDILNVHPSLEAARRAC